MAELEEYLTFAREIAYEAGRLTLGYFRRRLEVIAKADDSPVTVADREAESYIRRAIEARYPAHGIVGEEHGTKEAAADCAYRWVIDPIDGTKSFIHGVPLYTTLLGLLRDDESVVGVVEVPAVGDQLAAAAGLGAALNGRPARVSDVGNLAAAVGLTTDFLHLEQTFPRERWAPLFDGCRFSRTWGDAYGHYLVATGRAEFMLDPELNLHDCACLAVIMREAGGAFFDWSGRETVHGGNGISCNAALRPLVERVCVAAAE